MKKPGLILNFLLAAFLSGAQPGNCIFKPPQITINFGTGFINDPNTSDLYNYRRVPGFCPTDGHYAYASYTGGCFRDDWHTLTSDHTPGDNDGNMLLVNAAPYGGVFLSLPVMGLKPNTTYELSVYVINLCRPTKKCPSLLLPSLNMRLETPDGRVVATIVTSDLPRVEQPIWTRHVAFLTTPASTANLRLVMADNAPGGCGNDFALDDISFRECIRQTAATKKVAPAKKQPVAANASAKKPVSTKPAPSKTTTAKPVAKKPAPQPEKKTASAVSLKPTIDTAAKKVAIAGPPSKLIPPPPPILKTRTNELYKSIVTEAGQISINLYDNGEIDGDTVSIYHNNRLIRSRLRLTQEAILITINVSDSEPHHELVMVAENLGSIPPNTSLMVINAGSKRYEVFVSSNTQKNAKVVFDLRK